MRLQPSGCYYHPGRAAVAVCSKCGVGICRECAVKDEYGTILCYQCGNEKLREEHREHRKRLKEAGGRFSKGTEFIIPGIIGILIVVVVSGLLFFSGEIDSSMYKGNFFIGLLAYLIFAYFLFSIPFSYIEITDLFAPKYDSLYNRFGKWYFRVAFSLFFGWIIFTFVWIRFIVRKISSNKI